MGNGKWITAMAYGVEGADGRTHVGLIVLHKKISMSFTPRNSEEIFALVTADLHWCADTALPWTELTHFSAQQWRIGKGG